MKKKGPSTISEENFCESHLLEEGFYVPKTELFDSPIPANQAKEVIRRELMHEGKALLNLATFVQTSMDSSGSSLLSETMDKNTIDKT